jgi:hypothetical protein
VSAYSKLRKSGLNLKLKFIILDIEISSEDRALYPEIKNSNLQKVPREL